MKITYPITDNVKREIRNYPNIERNFLLPEFGRSEYEIVRLLNNVHEGAAKRSLELLDRNLPVSGDIGIKVLKTKRRHEMYQSFAELALLVFLQGRFGRNAKACDATSASKCPDILVNLERGILVKIEVYSPVDFMGLQLLEDYSKDILRYLDIELGYTLKMKTVSIEGEEPYDQESLFYAYSIPNENVVYEWLKEFQNEVRSWLMCDHTNSKFRKIAPGGRLEFFVEIIETSNDSDQRCIPVNWAERSTDSKLFFERVSAEDTLKSQWGRKLKGKIFRRQCGSPSEETLRVLVVNFALVDTGWPDFILKDPFSTNFKRVIRLIMGQADHYDLILPALLILDPCQFGQPVWISESWKEKGQAFVESFIS